MATDPLEVLHDDPNLRRLNRAARLAPDGRTNAAINQQREQYIQARLDEQHAAELEQARTDRGAYSDQVEPQFASENRPRYTDPQASPAPPNPTRCGRHSSSTSWLRNNAKKTCALPEPAA